jgi:hypothetical protein
MAEQYLSEQQKERIGKYLNSPPRSLREGLDPADFPRELDTFIINVSPARPVTGWDRQTIGEGKVFRLTRFAVMVLAALQQGHDRDGIFGEPKTAHSVNPDSYKITRTEWDELVSDIQDVVLSIEPDMQFQFDPVEMINYGPRLIEE